MVIDFSKMSEESTLLATDAYNNEDWETLKAISAKHFMVSGSSFKPCCSNPVKEEENFKEWWHYARRENII